MEGDNKGKIPEQSDEVLTVLFRKVDPVVGQPIVKVLLLDLKVQYISFTGCTMYLT